MGVIWADPGGEFYYSLGVAGAVTAKAIDDQNNVVLSNSAPAGRSTTYSYKSTSTNCYFGKFFGNFQETITGWASYNTSTSYVNGNRLWACQDGTTQQVDLRVDATGHLYFTRNGTTIGSTSSGTVSPGWHYFEVKCKIASGTSGSAEVKMDGTVMLTITGVNTQNSGAAQMNRIYWLAVVQASTQHTKDIYILDTGTGTNTTYLGNLTVKVLYANAAGTNQQWAANTGTQVAAVQDGKSHSGTWPDDDTTYIFDTVSGHVSAFAMDSVGAPASVASAVHVTYARRDSIGSRSINQVAQQSGGSTVETGSAIGLTTTYQYYYDVLEQNPTGPAAWTHTTLDATEFGTKIT